MSSTAAYIRWVRKQPCCVCGMPGPSHAHHHTNGPTYPPDAPAPEKSVGNKRGKSQKASDWYTLAVCFKCHRKLHEFEGPFRDYNGTERDAWQFKQVDEHHDRFDAEHPGPGAAAPLAPSAITLHANDPRAIAQEFCRELELGDEVALRLERLLRSFERRVVG
jgi:hypothetical protein